MEHVGPGPWSGPFVHEVHHGWFWFGWLMPILFLAVVAGLVVWIVLRTTRRPPAPAVAGGWVPRFGPDPAVEHARMRYARGELSRQDYLRVREDLTPGGPAVAPPPPATSPPQEEPG
jgi:uncharacterized membrane protein